MSRPRASILIPTLNAEPDLERLLPALDAQVVEGAVERIAIDSDSSDATRQLMRRAGFQVVCIPRREFGHGETRNELARLASGELLCFLSQDAVPEGASFLARMLEHAERSGVGAVSARLQPHAGDDALTARSVLAAPEAAEDVRVLSREDVEGLVPRERARRILLHNVASCYRAEALAEVPFAKVPFGEDAAWALAALEAGWSITHAGDCIARHSHRYEPGEAFARYRHDARLQRREYDFRARPGLASVLRGIAYELREDWRFVRREGRSPLELLRAPQLRLAQVLGQYVGGRG